MIEAGCLFICPKISVFFNSHSFYITLVTYDSRNENTEGQGQSFFSNNEMMKFLKGFRQEMGQFSKSLSDLTTCKIHIEEKMSSFEQEDEISLHSRDDFSVEETDPPKKK